jgi:hypothetical protein
MTPDIPKPSDDKTQIFHALRNKLLTMDPQEVSIEATPEHPNVWGVLMEFIISKTVVSLAALVDGTSSLYSSTGSGILGSGNHPRVGEAAREMVAAAETALESTRPAELYPFPKKGTIRFYLLTHHGIHTVECAEMELTVRKNSLSKLYAAGQYLLAQIQLVSEKKSTG